MTLGHPPFLRDRRAAIVSSISPDYLFWLYLQSGHMDSWKAEEHPDCSCNWHIQNCLKKQQSVTRKINHSCWRRLFNWHQCYILWFRCLSHMKKQIHARLSKLYTGVKLFNCHLQVHICTSDPTTQSGGLSSQPPTNVNAFLWVHLSKHLLIFIMIWGVSI